MKYTNLYIIYILICKIIIQLLNFKKILSIGNTLFQNVLLNELFNLICCVMLRISCFLNFYCKYLIGEMFVDFLDNFLKISF